MPNPKLDARAVFEIVKDGGIAIIPMNVGYGIIAIDEHALNRIFHAKQRKPCKRHVMIGNYSLHSEIHILPPRAAKAVKLLAMELDLPIGVVAPYRTNHPMIQRIPSDILHKSVVDGTLAMLVNAGELAEEISKLASAEGLPIMGSSANITGRGTKIIVEEIEIDVLKVADIVVDYGRQKFNYPQASSTMIDFRQMKILRYGACYDVIKDSLWRFCNIKVPNDPRSLTDLSGDRS